MNSQNDLKNVQEEKKEDNFSKTKTSPSVGGVSGQGQSGPASVSFANQKDSQTTMGKAKGKILLVEDDLPMVKMYKTRLELEGFEVEWAGDGAEALVKVKSFKPDLVLLDLMIPKIGGMEVLEGLRKDLETRALAVIILSNLSQENDITRAKELGVKEFLIKSNYTPTQVVEIVRKHVTRNT